MRLTRGELLVIAARATSLHDRLDGISVLPLGDDPKRQMKIDARLKEWAYVVADGDQELFQKRLAYDGLNVHTVRPVLGDIEYTQILPSWTAILDPVLQKSAGLELDGLHERFPCLRGDEPLPFEEILLPFVLTGRGMLAAPGNRDLLTGQARADLERFLLVRMSESSSRVLEMELNTFLACLQFRGVTPNAAYRDRASRKLYLDFARSMREGGLLTLFKEYPVLARRLAVRLGQWVQLVEEFEARLCADLASIKVMFFDEQDVGRVTSLETGLSDPHRQGRTVIIARFESGVKLVYKPKDMGLEYDYFRYADWLNTRGSPLDLKVLKVLNRGSYGWVEFVGAVPMKDEEQARRFYLRSGMLLCLIHVCDV